jgi:hypothetical protein
MCTYRARGRSNYQLLKQGYIGRDVWHTRSFHVDCTASGAERVFDDLCRAFERVGWELGGRSFDSPRSCHGCQDVQCGSVLLLVLLIAGSVYAAVPITFEED